MLEPIWSGQKGVYIGSGLRGMESYSTHAPTVEGFARTLFSSVDLVEDYIRVYGPVTRQGLFALMGGDYAQVQADVDRLLKQKRIRVRAEAAVVGTRGRNTQQFEAVTL